MKTPLKLYRIAPLLCGAALVLTSCSRQDEPAPAAAGPAPATGEDVTTPLPPALSPAAEEAKQQAAEAQAALESAAAEAQSQAQSLFDRAKELIASENYKEALNILGELSKLQLTPEQQQTLQQLTARVQQALAGQSVPDPAKAVGDLLPRNR